ncbi:MAG: fibronectin type III domain-containing protein [Burkholderiales bacterium]
MKRIFACIAAVAAAALLASCGNGSPASPPTDVSVVAGDGSVTVSWTMASEVEYWLFYAPASSITTDNWTSLPGSQVRTSVTSPRLVTALTNGATYAFTVNGRYGHGPGGAGSPSLAAVPRLAGAAWTAGTSLAATNLRGVAYGAAYVAVGDAGTMFSSPDGITWTPQISNVTTDLNAAIYGGNYVAVGIGGVILQSSDSVTWTPRTSPTPSSLNAVTTNGGGVYAAVGAAGTIITSSDTVTWTPAVSGITPNDLYAVTYGNGLYVAVGASGTLLTSADASNWTLQAVTPSTASALRGVAYGSATVGGTATPLFVAVGDAGTLVTSPDGVNWTLQSPIGSSTLNAVTFGHQFIAVGNGGSIFTSVDGVTWPAATSVTPATSSNLYGVAHNATDPYGYSAVGAAGVNLSAF